MKNTSILTKTIILPLVSILLLISCKNKNKEEVDEDSETKIETVKKGAMANGLYCFKNEYSFEDDPTIKDVIELYVSIDGEKASGSYNWLPTEKDQRKGTFNGSISNGVITAKYSYSQEGEETSTDIIIIISSNNAVVETAELNLGLGPIAKVNCELL